jgi:hypothetical protein
MHLIVCVIAYLSYSASNCTVLYSTVQSAVVCKETFTELPDLRGLICM